MEASLLYKTVGLAQRGDLEAFLKLVDAYSPQLFEFLLRRTGDVEVAHDVTAEVMIRAYEDLHRFAPDKGVSFDVWLLRCAYKELYEHYRDHAPHISEDIVNDIYLEVHTTTGFVPSKLSFEHLNTLLAALHSWQALSYDAVYFMNKPLSDVVYILGVREKKVEKFLHTTKKHISQFLGFDGLFDEALMKRLDELHNSIPMTRAQYESLRVKHIIELSVSEGRMMHTSAHKRALYHLAHLRYQPSNKRLPLIVVGVLIVAALVVMGVAIQYAYPGSILFTIDSRIENVRALLIRDPDKRLSYELDRVEERLSEFGYLQTFIGYDDEKASARIELEAAIAHAQHEALDIMTEYELAGAGVPAHLQRLKLTLDSLQQMITDLVNKKQTVDFSTQDHIFENFDVDGYLGR